MRFLLYGRRLQSLVTHAVLLVCSVTASAKFGWLFLICLEGFFCSSLTLPVSMAASTSLHRCSFGVLLFMDQPSPAVRELKRAPVLATRYYGRQSPLQTGGGSCVTRAGFAPRQDAPGGRVCRGARETSPFSLHKTLSFLFSTLGKSSERASYSTFGRDTGMPGLNQVTIKGIEIFLLHLLAKLLGVRAWE